MTSLPPRWALTPPFHPCRSEIPGDGSCGLSARRPRPDAFTGGCFLLRSHDLTAIKSLACVALCVARTFLPRPVAGSDRAGLRCKDREKLRDRGLCAVFFCRRTEKVVPLPSIIFNSQFSIFNYPFFKGSSPPSGIPCRAGSGTGGRILWANSIRRGGGRRRRNFRVRDNVPCPSLRRRRRACGRWRCA